MIRLDEVSEEDKTKLDHALADIAEIYALPSPLSIDALVDAWARLVKAVEAGYRLSIYDYTHDLMHRDALAELLHGLPALLEESIRVAVQPLDERFLFATQSADVPLAPDIEAGAARWWYRMPRLLVGELRQDLQELGSAAARSE
jgi:hypothetical protein